ncbi:hypothetical protein N6J05_003839 [Escherichia coli]|nr:hypothetical protein [Escherichia coli]EJV1939214.1 hypothetical protein [Escherichia coli]
MFHHKDKWFDKEWLSALWSTSKRLMENTQATDAFLAEVRAQGVEMFADHLLCPDLDDTIRDFAAQIRKGGKQ